MARRNTGKRFFPLAAWEKLAASLALALSTMVAAAAPAKGAAKSAAKPDALAVLEANCVSCHGGEKTKGGLDLTTRESLMRGGESGPSVVPGKPQSSLLYQL
ncbi:MAG: hypothetical protein HY300_16350, partial [Verrucomicrobia bacterium]|nr:hypothetical protein [Verrucomicrobiota bacterium]